MRHTSMILVLILSGVAWAEEGNQQNSATPPLMASFDLDFGGGTLSELLQEVEAQSGLQPNVMVEPSVAELSVPAMHLRGVSTWSLLQGLGHLLQGNENCQLSIRVSNNPQQADAIVTMSCIPINPVKEKLRGTVRPVLFVISDLLEHYELEDIHTAINTALEMAYGEEAKPMIKFHFETKLLMAKCDRPEHMEVVMTVLSDQDLFDAFPDRECLLARGDDGSATLYLFNAEIQNWESGPIYSSRFIQDDWKRP